MNERVPMETMERSADCPVRAAVPEEAAVWLTEAKPDETPPWEELPEIPCLMRAQSTGGMLRRMRSRLGRSCQRIPCLMRGRSMGGRRRWMSPRPGRRCQRIPCLTRGRSLGGQCRWMRPRLGRRRQRLSCLIWGKSMGGRLRLGWTNPLMRINSPTERHHHRPQMHGL